MLSTGFLVILSTGNGNLCIGNRYDIDHEIMATSYGQVLSALFISTFREYSARIFPIQHKPRR